MSDDEFDGWDDNIDWNALSAAHHSSLSSSYPSTSSRAPALAGQAATAAASTPDPTRTNAVLLEESSKRPSVATLADTTSNKRKRSDEENKTSYNVDARPNKRPFIYESPSKKVRDALESYDDEMSCPICLELLVEPRLLNPCGHSTCGGCIVKWLRRSTPGTCPTCRMKLSSHIPNVTVKNMVQKHVEVMRSNKAQDWYDDGSKFKDLCRRQKEHQEILKESNKPNETVGNLRTGSRNAAPAPSYVRRTTRVELYDYGQTFRVDFGDYNLQFQAPQVIDIEPSSEEEEYEEEFD